MTPYYTPLTEEQRQEVYKAMERMTALDLTGFAYAALHELCKRYAAAPPELKKRAEAARTIHCAAMMFMDAVEDYAGLMADQ